MLNMGIKKKGKEKGIKNYESDFPWNQIRFFQLQSLPCPPLHVIIIKMNFLSTHSNEICVYADFWISHVIDQSCTRRSKFAMILLERFFCREMAIF